MKKLSQLVVEQELPDGINGFCILKPEFTQYENEFFTLLKNNDWKVVDKKKKKLTRDEAEKLYASKKGESFYNTLVDYMASGECIAASCSKKCKDPITDMKKLKDKVREQWGKDEMKNAMHCSDSLENVTREANICLNGICESKEEPINEADTKELQISVNVSELIKKLKDAFCEEMNAWYQYIIVAPFLKGNERTNIAADYAENADEELKHAKWLLERINQLDGDYSDIDAPEFWDKTATHKYIYPTGVDVAGSLKQMVEAEKGAIETYTDLEKFTRDKDVVTNTKVKEILADEQKHLQEMEEFLADIEK